jgi:hypothetical protein
MAKVRKKYNKNKQLTRVADHIMKNILICYTDDIDGCVFYDKKGGYLVKPTHAMIASASRPHKWSIYMAAFGRTIVDEYFKGEQLFTTSRYYHEDLVKVLEEKHQKVIESVPENHRCGVGWIGSVLGEDIPEKLAGDIFTKLEAWKK